MTQVAARIGSDGLAVGLDADGKTASAKDDERAVEKIYRRASRISINKPKKFFLSVAPFVSMNYGT